LSTLSWRRER